MPNSNCIICDSLNPSKEFYPGIVRCPNCGLVYADIHVTNDELAEIYNKNYFLGGEYTNYIKDRPAIQRNFLERIKVLEKFSSGGNLFEIGSAYGFFLELAQKKWKVRGIDISQEACAYAKNKMKLDVICGDFLSVNIEKGVYDVFCMWDTIEHLKSPHLYLKKISDYVRQGGLLCITTGDIESLNSKIRRNKWRLIHPPTHLYYFSKKTLSMLLEKYGFEIIYFNKCGYYKSLNQILHSLLIENNSRLKKKVYSLLKKTSFLDCIIKINLFDIMFVVAKSQEVIN